MKTIQDFEDFLNSRPIPLHLRKSNGGPIPDGEMFGTWLRTYDLNYFLLGYQSFN